MSRYGPIRADNEPIAKTADTGGFILSSERESRALRRLI